MSAYLKCDLVSEKEEQKTEEAAQNKCDAITIPGGIFKILTRFDLFISLSGKARYVSFGEVHVLQLTIAN